MQLFTPAHHRGLHCDALLIDSDRSARPLELDLAAPLALDTAAPLALDGAAPLAPVVGALLDRVALMSRSLHAVRHYTFGLFCAVRGERFVLAPAYPVYASIFSSLRETLEEFGTVRRGRDESLRDEGLDPLVAFVGGRVSFFRGTGTRRWQRLASRRGLRIVAGVWSHRAGDDLYVGGLPAAEYLAAPAEVTLDLDVPDELPPDEREPDKREPDKREPDEREPLLRGREGGA